MDCDIEDDAIKMYEEQPFLFFFLYGWRIWIIPFLILIFGTTGKEDVWA